MLEETPKMTQKTKDILLRARKIVLLMLEKFHEGTKLPTTTIPLLGLV